MSSSKGFLPPKIKTCCGICEKSIAKNHRNILCQLCNTQVHITCNKTDAKTYEKINRDKIPQTCLRCQADSLLYQNLSDSQFIAENQNITLPAITSTRIKCKICTKTIAKKT